MSAEVSTKSQEIKNREDRLAKIIYDEWNTLYDLDKTPIIMETMRRKMDDAFRDILKLENFSLSNITTPDFYISFISIDGIQEKWDELFEYTWFGNIQLFAMGAIKRRLDEIIDEIQNII